MNKSLRIILRVIIIVIVLVIIFEGFRLIHNYFSNTVGKDDRSIIVVSIYPYELMVRQLVGDQVDVVSIIPPNASPHTWSPNPSDLAMMYKANLIISNGLGLETNLQKVFDQYSAKHLEIASLLDPELLDRDGDDDHNHHDSHHDAEHHHGDIDPHIWTSPELLINITNAVSGSLIGVYPNLAELIKQNASVMIRELMAADQRIQNDRNDLTNPAVVTYHNSFQYFTDRYGIHCVGFVQSSPGKEPSPRELSELGKKIKEYKVKSIFIEPQMNPKSAEVLASEFKLQLLTLDPLGNTLNPNSISDYILKNWEIMKSGL